MSFGLRAMTVKELIDHLGTFDGDMEVTLGTMGSRNKWVYDMSKYSTGVRMGKDNMEVFKTASFESGDKDGVYPLYVRDGTRKILVIG